MLTSRGLFPVCAAASLGLVALVAVGGGAACSSSSASAPADSAADASSASESPIPIPPTDAATLEASGPDVLAGCTRDPGAPPQVVSADAPTDPAGGAAAFTLDKALKGFPAGAGKLTASITTEHGTIKCELFEAVAPISVANFVGLARGTRPFKSAGKWKVGRFFDGLLWHRVIPDFVIQGGDPDGDGTGGPGYDLVKENQVDEPLGALAQAAAKAPSGSQFYVVVGHGPAPNYNVFGNCATEAAVAIAGVARDPLDAPTTPVHMIKVDIARCP